MPHRFQLQYSRKLERRGSWEDVFIELGSDEDGEDSSPCSGPYGQSHPTPNFARSDDEGTRDGFAISGPKGGREARSRVGIGIREEREGVITFPEQIDDQLAPPPTPLKLGHGRHLGFHGRKGDPGRRVWL